MGENQYTLKKSRLQSLIEEINKNGEFIGPTKGSNEKNIKKSLFSKITNTEQIYLKTKTYYPVKTFFFKPDEVLLKFDGNNIINPEIKLKPQVFFGLRKCDLNSIWHQDIVFLEENPDPFYKRRRDNSLLIGYHCKKGDDYCFCNSFELTDFFDLMFFEKGDSYAIEVGSKKGLEFIEKNKSFFKSGKNLITDADRVTKNKKELKTTDIKDLYNNKDWEKGADKCLSCGACNFICGNCHCFEIDDNINFDLKTGERVRKPASCQLRNFTRVAGEHVFRISKLARFKHRIYHQIQYFKERHHVTFCTGCGRCIEGCPARIDWIKIINEMKK